MAQTLFALFGNSKLAGEAVADLKQQGFSENISLVAKDENSGAVKSHQVKENVTEGAVAGTTIGAAMGALTGIIAGLSSLAIPGFGAAVVAGPLFASWALSGAAAGALAGGLTGALVDAGIPEEKAKMFEDYIQQGQVLVAVTVPEDRQAEVDGYLRDAGAADVLSVKTKE